MRDFFIHTYFARFVAVLSIVALIVSSSYVVLQVNTPEAYAAPRMTHDRAFYMTDGDVRDMVRAPDGSLYIGGSFTKVGRSVGHFVGVDQTTDAFVQGLDMLSGYVRSAVPDGLGGWYIGGSFSSIGGVTRNNIAHIMSDGTLDTGWDPNADAEIYSLALSGTTLYAGGDFTNIGGASRNAIAALDTTTGLATAWNPNSSSRVRDMIVAGGTLYAAGDFALIGGQGRQSLAALDTTTGLATSWHPGSDGTVNKIILSGTTIYVAGLFTTIGGAARNNIAAIDTTIATSNATAWDPNSDNEVSSIVLSGTTLYAGGQFTNIGGSARNRIAALDTTINTSNATAWDPNSSGAVNALLISGSTIYAGGTFTTIGGQSRVSLAALDITTGLATAWDPQLGVGTPTLNWLGQQGATIFFSGSNLEMVDTTTRNNIAQLDSAGKVTAWDPDSAGTVEALELSGTTLYAGGFFISIGGAARSRIAALDTTINTNNATAWNPGANTAVLALHLNGDLYVGGAFTSIGGSSRNYAAALSTTTGLATGWDPDPDGFVLALASDGTGVYLGGSFTTVNAGGVTRNGAARVLYTTGLADTWDPNVAGAVYAIRVSGSDVYLGGNFLSVSGSARNRIAKISTGSILSSWDPNANSTVRDIIVTTSGVVVGGDFTTIGGQARDSIAILSSTTGLATSWDASITDGNINRVLAQDQTLYVAGSMCTVGTDPNRCGIVFFPNAIAGITSTAPGFKNTGDTGFSLTINGTDFTSGSVLRWSGSDRTTSFGSETALSVTIPSSDLIAAATVPLTVFNPTPGGGLSAALNFAVYDAGSQVFTKPETAVTGSGSVFRGMQIIDMNNDGEEDLVGFSLSGFIGSYLTVNLSNGDGTFGADNTITTLLYGNGVAVNLDLDGFPEIVAINASSSSSIMVLANDGAGLPVYPGTTHAVTPGASQVHDVIATDVDGDTDLDIVITKRTTHEIGVYLNTGLFSGTLSAVSLYSTGAGTNPVELRSINIDGDADQDIITQNDNGTMSVLLNNGSGVFGAPTNYSLTGVLDIEVGNVDGGTDVEVVAATASSFVVYQNTAGTLSQLATYARSDQTNSLFSKIKLVDFDGDTDLDILTSSNRDSLNDVGFDVWYGNGAGAFTTATHYDTNDLSSLQVETAAFLETDDLDDDGDLDVVVSRHGVDGDGQMWPMLQTTVTSILPTTITAGGGNFTLAVNGNDFDTDAVVEINGSARATTWVSSGQITATVLSSDIAAAGSLQVRVRTDGLSRSRTPAQTLTVQAAVANTVGGGGTSESQKSVFILTDISPRRRGQGSGTTTINLIGAGFTQDTRVRMGIYDLVTTYVSETQLRAIVSEDIMRTQATHDVVVLTGDGIKTEYRVSDPIRFTVTAPEVLTLALEGSVVPTKIPDFASIPLVIPAGTNGVSFDQVNWQEDKASAVAITGSATGGSGYTVMVRQDGDLRTDDGQVIRGFDGNTGVPAPNAQPLPWVTPSGTGFFGYSTTNTSLIGGLADRFFSGNVRRWAALTTVDAPIVSHTGDGGSNIVSFKDYLLLRLGLGQGQASGTYKNNVVITIIPHVE